MPFAVSGAKACIRREKSFEAEVYGVQATFSAHQYRAWSFEQLQLRYESLSEGDKAALEPVLVGASVMPAMMADGILHNALFDGFTPPYINDGIPDARIKRIKEKEKEKSQ